MFQLNAVPKPQHRRNAPTAKQRGQISTKVRKQLRERSGGICERCNNNLAVHAGHLVRRWLIEETGEVGYDKAPLWLTIRIHLKERLLRLAANADALGWYLRDLWRQ